jgi:hypothetical protein
MNSQTPRLLVKRSLRSGRLSLRLPVPRRVKSTLPPPTSSTAKTVLASTAQQSQQQSSKNSRWFEKAWEAYCEALLKQPLLTKASTASFIFFSSDAATQYITDQDETFDVTRAASGAAFGVFGTTWLHYWWGFLESFGARRIPIATYGRLANTVGKVAIDQAIAAPAYYYCYYVLTNFIQKFMAAASSENPKTAYQILEETNEKASEMIIPTMQRHWSIWPAIHCLNFYYNPLQHRVLVQNLCLVGWSGCK